jgi:uncharacterized membrane protein YphA (DoxX/SURF4 family)
MITGIVYAVVAVVSVLYCSTQFVLTAENDLTLAVISTGAEILFGLLLLVGWHTRTAALVKKWTK